MISNGNAKLWLNDHTLIHKINSMSCYPGVAEWIQSCWSLVMLCNSKDPYSLPSARHSLQLENRILEIKLLETSSRPKKQAQLPKPNPVTLRWAEWQRTFTDKWSHLPSLGILTINTLVKSTTLFRWYRKNKAQQPFISDGGHPWWPCAFYAMHDLLFFPCNATSVQILR